MQRAGGFKALSMVQFAFYCASVLVQVCKKTQFASDSNFKSMCVKDRPFMQWNTELAPDHTLRKQYLSD